MAPRQKTRQKRGHNRKRKTQRGRGRLVQTPTVAIFRPPLKCKDERNTPYRSNAYIGKLVKQDAATRTTQLIDMLKAIDSLEEFTIPPLLNCELAPEQDNVNAKNNLFISQNYKFQEIQKFGGISLHKRLENQEPLADVLLPLELFFTNLAKFNTKFVHKDLHTDNLVWDGSTYKMIDFETMVPRSTIEDVVRDDIELYTNTINQNILTQEVEFYMQHYDRMTLTLSLIEDLTTNYPETPLAQGFAVLIGQQEPISNSIITHYGLKDYADSFKVLFDELRS